MQKRATLPLDRKRHYRLIEKTKSIPRYWHSELSGHACNKTLLDDKAVFKLLLSDNEK